MSLKVFPLEGIGPVSPGDDVARLLVTPLETLSPQSGDVVVVTHKIVSKAEGQIRVIEGDETVFKRNLVEEEAVSIIRRRGKGNRGRGRTWPGSE